MTKPNILSFTPEELKEMFKISGLPAYRGEQVFEWLHQKRVTSFDDMTNLSLELRNLLKENYSLPDFEVQRRQVSKLDDTVKYLYKLEDNNCIETVQMQYHHGTSLCVSTQVGCRMGCGFCASTIGGLVRNLTAGEILRQVYKTEAISGYRISNIVLMGIGEPLDNFDEVVRFLKIISHPKGKNMSLRNITLSTCGIADKIIELAELDMPITLAISLHAPNNERRSEIMPINRRFDIEELLNACKIYFETTKRRLTFEYGLIDGVNDTPKEALELAQLLADFKHSHINLIPVNPVAGKPFKSSQKKAVEEFADILNKKGFATTVRRELGRDISAACGQLRRESASDVE